MKIPVIELEFYDGSKFFLRTDVPKEEVQALIKNATRKKGKEFLLLPAVRQIELKRESFKKIGGLVRITKMEMEEVVYAEIPLSDVFDIGDNNGEEQEENPIEVRR